MRHFVSLENIGRPNWELWVLEA